VSEEHPIIIQAPGAAFTCLSRYAIHLLAPNYRFCA